MKKKLFAVSAAMLALICCQSAAQNRGNLRIISHTKKAGIGYAVCVNNDYAYVTNNDGVAVFDVRQPERPRRISRIPTGVTFGISVENDLAYISAKGGLVISDVGDPASPKIISEHSLGKETYRVVVSGSLAYITSNEGMDILDISDPKKIISTGHFGENRTRGIDIIDGIAYLACFGSGVKVIDMTAPFSPKEVTTIEGTKGACGIHAHGESLYVGRHGAGVAIFDISDRKSPRLIGTFRDDDGGEALSVWGDGRCLYVADNYGVEVLDISDPANPFEIGEYRKVSGAHSLCVEGATIYVASASKGLMILHFGEEQP